MKKTKVNEDRKTDRQADRGGGGGGKREETVKGEKRERDFFFFFLGWADLTCPYLPRVKSVRVILLYSVILLHQAQL